jgi:alpha-tubulin suppressor-like RCC1 family protein
LKNKLRQFFVGVLVACVTGLSALGYVYSTHQSVWTPGGIPMQIKLGGSTLLSDGTSYSTSLQAAMQTWNQYLGTVQFVPQIVPESSTQTDYVNDIYFSSTIEGEAFGSGVLAVTLTYRSPSVFEIVEADIIFNTAWTWDSYRGNLREPEDIRRVGLHELGHVLGLTHPDEHGQNTSALMNSTASNLDGLTADDIAGAQSIYRAPGQTYGPSNDNFVNASVISLASGSTQATGTNLYATTEAGEPNHDPAGGVGGASVWWKWTAPVSGSVTLNTNGSKFDTLLGVYVGSAVSGLTLIVSNDDVQSGVLRYSLLTFSATAGVTYYFAVDGWGGAAGLVALNMGIAVADVAPTITSQPASRTVFAGDSVTFSVSATGIPAPTYQWQQLQPGGSWQSLTNGGALSGATAATLSFSAVDIGANGYQFRCVVGNRAGSAISNAASLTVSPPPPPSITVQPTSQMAIPEGMVRFTVVAAGATSYRWQILPLGGSWSDLIASTNYRGTTSAMLTVGDITATTVGTQFRCVVGNPYGSVMSDVVMFTINQAAIIAVSAGEFHSVFLKSDGTLWAAGHISDILGSFASVFNFRPGLLATNVIQASAGSSYTLFVKADHSLWAMGSNTFGQLGNGGTNYCYTPVQIATGVLKASAGSNSSLFIKTDGSLWGMGRMTGPNSGLISSLSPSFIASGVVDAAAGASSNLFVKSDGTMWGWGENQMGQLGNGTNGGIFAPQQITTNVSAVAISVAHSLIIKNDGSLWAAGSNSAGQLGDGSAQTRYTPVQVSTGVVKIHVGYNHSLFLKADGTLWGMGSNTWGQLGTGSLYGSTVPINIAVGVSEAAAGPSYYGHSVYLKTDGSLWAMGFNGRYQLGDGSDTNKFASVYITGNFAPAISAQPENQTVAVSSAGNFSVLASGAPTPNYQWQRLPIGGGNWDNIADGGIYSGSTEPTLTITGATLAMSGDQFRCGVTNSSGSATSNTATLTVFVPLPVITSSPASQDVAVGAPINLGVAASSPVELSYQWQKNGDAIDGATSANYAIASAQVSDAGDYSVVVTNSAGSVPSASAVVTVASGPPVITTPPTSQTVTGGDTFSFAVTATSNVSLRYQWRKGGAPLSGATQSSYSKTNAQFIDAGDYTVDVSNAAGVATSAVATLTVAGSVPVITTQPQHKTSFVAVPVAFNLVATGVPFPIYQWQRRLATGGSWINLSDGGVYFGGNTATLSVGSPSLAMNGDQFRCIVTNALGSVTSNAATLTVRVAGFVKLSAGRYHSLRVDTVSQLYVTGTNTQGQLGTGNTTTVTTAQMVTVPGQTITDVAAGAEHSLFLTSAKEVWATGLNTTGQLGDGTNAPKVTPIKLATNAVGMAAGNFHSVVLKSDGTLWTVGGNDYGQLGNGTTTDTTALVKVASEVIDMAAGIRQTLFLKTDGTLWAMGNLDGSETAVRTPVQLASSVKTMAAGGYHSLFVKTDGTLWAMGYNPYGQLGTGDTTTRITPVQVATGVESVTAGYFFSLYTKTDRSLWAMGYNSFGQLGDGTTTTRPTAFQLTTNAVAASASESYTLYTKTNGSLWAVGLNGNGQFGNGGVVTTSLPVQIAGGMILLPERPTGLMATPGEIFDRVHLSWAPQGEATAFEVWRNTSDDSGSAVRIASSLRWATYTDLTVTPGQAYYYWVKALNSTGISQFSTSEAVYNGADLPPLKITMQPESQSVEAGGTVTFAVAASGTAPLLYQWRRDEEIIPAATNATYTIENAVLTDSGDYDVIVSDISGSITSTVATFTVTKRAQTITFNEIADRGYTDEPIALTATASSGLVVAFGVVEGPATLNGTTLTLEGAGTVTIRATQVGDATYAAAPSVERSFVITASFGSWRLAQFTEVELLDATVSGPAAVFGQDGLPNLVKYALGLDPKVNATDGLPEVTTSASDWVYTYTRPSSVTDVTYEVEVSTDLVTWTTEGVVHGRAEAGSTETWQATYPVSLAANLYFRLKVTATE